MKLRTASDRVRTFTEEPVTTAFERLREAADGRTTIIITHRFTTAMQADVIHVMEEGRIVESGSHE